MGNARTEFELRWIFEVLFWSNWREQPLRKGSKKFLTPVRSLWYLSDIMLNTLRNLFLGKNDLRIPVEDMGDVMRFEKKRHKASLVFDSEITGRSTLALHLEYQGQRVIYRGVSIVPGEKPCLGRRYEA